MIISVFGKNGAGKTTISTHLAKYLSDNNNFVGIISLEMRYGSLQRSIGVKVSQEKSIINALTQSDIKDYFTRYSDNIYICTLSDADDITKYDAIYNIAKDEKIISEFFNKIKEAFDYVIIDLTEMVIDNFTYFSIKNSDKLINVTESRPESIAFANSHKDILNTFLNEKNIINVINKHEESIINKTTIQEIYDADFFIDFDSSAIKDERQNTINKYILSKMSVLYKNIETVSTDNKKTNIFSKILRR